ncbi:MAG: efflux RND transporter periplasmic adaptor subunit [Chloroflexota bacterium]
MKRLVCFAAGLLVSATILAGCGRIKGTQKPPTPVRVQTVGMSSVEAGQRYSATITPYEQVNMAFKVGGYIREILQIRGVDGRLRNAQQGDTVKKGSVLARVREADYINKVNQAKSQLAQAQASYLKATQDWERASNLFATQSMIKPDYDAAKARLDETQSSVEGARAQLAEAQLNLQYCALIAPIDGMVLQRAIEIGTLVTSGSVGFILADLSRVKVVFGVPDTMLAQLKLGTSLPIVTESIRNVSFPGQITAISPSADPRSRVFSIEVTVPNPKQQLKAGMIASLQIGGEKTLRPVPTVALGAIVSSQTNPKSYAVFVVEKSAGKTLARLRNVQLGDVYGNTIGATAGLRPGDQVVVTGGTLLRDGDPVAIIP